MTRAASLLTWPSVALFRLWEVFLVSLTIQIGMVPIMAHYFHRVSMSGPLANMPALLLSSLIVPFGFITLGLDALWTRLGEFVARLAGWPTLFYTP